MLLGSVGEPTCIEDTTVLSQGNPYLGSVSKFKLQVLSVTRHRQGREYQKDLAQRHLKPTNFLYTCMLYAGATRETKSKENEAIWENGLVYIVCSIQFLLVPPHIATMLQEMQSGALHFISSLPGAFAEKPSLSTSDIQLSPHRHSINYSSAAIPVPVTLSHPPKRLRRIQRGAREAWAGTRDR